ncbi:MAG: ATP-binding protein [Actinomycetia bacterium]|nr:ATP-binding protein [Actinomycetes bacterium]MCH9701942.1 ATP-binding protein [Actinomycetes bacterium]MCH9759196.1 ATP-binding protein [Actinomycetes bacterium]
MAETARAGLISVVGGESTGKSTLAAALGQRLGGIVVSEVLRAWVDQHQGRVPQPHEQAEVMSAHRESEVAALRRADCTASRWVISDSGPLMTAVYSLQYYNDSSLLPTALEWTAHSDAVVWCQDDFPWQPDPQRDGSQARTTTQRILSAIFAEHPALPVRVVHGSLEERIAAVETSVERAIEGEPR